MKGKINYSGENTAEVTSFHETKPTPSAEPIGWMKPDDIARFIAEVSSR